MKRRRPWQVGDVVIVWPSGYEHTWVGAVVTGVDDGPRPGVSLHLAATTNGVDTAYATHDELVLATEAEFAARLATPPT